MNMKTGETILEVSNLNIEYRTDLETVYAVNGISFTLEKGDTLGLVGETGAGKTSTALSLMRLLPQPVGVVASGTISFQGQDISQLNSNEMRALRGGSISMIFQDPMTSLNPIMTVGKQIRESVRIHNHDNLSSEAIDRRVEEVLELVGIPASRKNDYPMQFSGGMKQRIVIAIALACSPLLLIADEPTTALDVTIQAQVLALIRQLKEQLGTSVIMITHDLGVVAQTCTKVAIMYAGEIVEYGSVYDIFDMGKAHHPYTIGLFGAIPDIYSNAPRLKPIGGLIPDPTQKPVGCVFASRCPKCVPQCQESKPGFTELDGHKLACFYPNEGGGEDAE